MRTSVGKVEVNILVDNVTADRYVQVVWVTSSGTKIMKHHNIKISSGGVTKSSMSLISDLVKDVLMENVQ